MLIMSRVCVDFMNKNGEKIFSVTPASRFSVLEAPEAIKNDPMFDMLLAEGSLEAVTKVNQKAIENDPVGNADATGKATTIASAERKTRKSKETEVSGDKAENTAETKEEAGGK